MTVKCHSCEGFYLGGAPHPSFKLYAYGTTFQGHLWAIHSGAAMTTIPSQPTTSCNSISAKEEGVDPFWERWAPSPYENRVCGFKISF